MRPSVCPGSFGDFRQAQPQHIHRRAAIDHLEIRRRRARWNAVPSAAMVRWARISSGPSGTLRGDADHAVAFADQAGGLGVHQQPEGRDSASPRSARKSRKSHCGMNATNFACVGRCVKSASWNMVIADLAGERAHLAVRPGEERIEQAEFVHHLHGRRMHGVAAEVAQEVARAFPAPPRRCRRAPAGSPASCRPARRRRCSSVSSGRASTRRRAAACRRAPRRAARPPSAAATSDAPTRRTAASASASPASANRRELYLVSSLLMLPNCSSSIRLPTFRFTATSRNCSTTSSGEPMMT